MSAEFWTVLHYVGGPVDGWFEWFPFLRSSKQRRHVPLAVDGTTYRAAYQFARLRGDLGGQLMQQRSDLWFRVIVLEFTYTGRRWKYNGPVSADSFVTTALHTDDDVGALLAATGTGTRK